MNRWWGRGLLVLFVFHARLHRRILGMIVFAAHRVAAGAISKDVAFHRCGVIPMVLFSRAWGRARESRFGRSSVVGVAQRTRLIWGISRPLPVGCLIAAVSGLLRGHKLIVVLSRRRLVWVSGIRLFRILVSTGCHLLPLPVMLRLVSVIILSLRPWLLIARVVWFRGLFPVRWSRVLRVRWGVRNCMTGIGGCPFPLEILWSIVPSSRTTSRR